MLSKYITNIEKIEGLSKQQIEKLKEVTQKYKFRANEYYLSLINWNDPKDPIRRIIVPQLEELEEWGFEDASKEHKYTKTKGLQHKYKDTVLLLVNDVCGGFCRFCFRKRLFINVGAEIARDLTEDLKYINQHKEITNVLLTGGDPLLLSTKRLERIISEIRKMEHIEIIRIGTKMLGFDPNRVNDDESFINMIKKFSFKEKRIYFMLHYNHPNEITNEAINAIDKLTNAGSVMANQTPLIKGLNDDPVILSDLFKKLSFIGVPPYYVFQGRPVMGNKPFLVPIEEGFSKFLKSISNISGLAKRARFAMSHETGKIEVTAMTKEHIIFKYLRAHNPDNYEKFFVFKRNPNAYWFDDYKESIEIYNI